MLEILLLSEALDLCRDVHSGQQSLFSGCFCALAGCDELRSALRLAASLSHFSRFWSAFPHLVACDLLLPELRIRLRVGIAAASVMTMPEASVHEDACPVLRQHDVRRSRQLPHIHPEPESLSMQPPAHLQLRGGVLSSDSGHVDMAGEGSEGAHSPL